MQVTTKLITFALKEKAMQELDNWLTVKQYANKYNVSINTIYKQIRTGLHKTVRKGQQKLIYDQKPIYRTTKGPQVFRN